MLPIKLQSQQMPPYQAERVAVAAEGGREGHSGLQSHYVLPLSRFFLKR